MQRAQEISQLTNKFHTYFKTISKDDWELKTSPGKWSRKETLGHLADSALTNLRRFIVTQYKQNDNIVYEQDEWVKRQGYQQMAIEDIITLWVALNKQIVQVVNAMPEHVLGNTCDTGKGEQQLHTLQFLIDDYISHMLHHLEQISQ